MARKIQAHRDYNTFLVLCRIEWQPSIALARPNPWNRWHVPLNIPAGRIRTRLSVSGKLVSPGSSRVTVYWPSNRNLFWGLTWSTSPINRIVGRGHRWISRRDLSGWVTSSARSRGDSRFQSIMNVTTSVVPWRFRLDTGHLAEALSIAAENKSVHLAGSNERRSHCARMTIGEPRFSIDYRLSWDSNGNYHQCSTFLFHPNKEVN